MAVNDIMSVVIEQSLHGQKVLNVLHYRVSVQGSDPAFQSSSLAEAVATSIVPKFKAVQSAELSHVAVYAQKIRPLPATLAVANTSAAGAGLIAGSSLPTSMATVITKLTPNAGKKYRGRVFVAGLPSANESDSTLAVAAQPGFADLADFLDSQISLVATGYSFMPVIFHRVGATFTDITGSRVRTILRNQRRRQVGVGQ